MEMLFLISFYQKRFCYVTDAFLNILLLVVCIQISSKLFDQLLSKSFENCFLISGQVGELYFLEIFTKLELKKTNQTNFRFLFFLIWLPEDPSGDGDSVIR